MLAEFVANNTVNVATVYNRFFLNSGGHPIAPLVLMYCDLLLISIKAMETILNGKKATLEESQANLSIT